jgi:hypothetical protein
MKKTYFTILILYFLNIGCVRETIITNDALVLYEEKPVIYCFLTESDSIYAWVAHTLPVGDVTVSPEDIYVFDADINIYNESGNSIKLNLINQNKPIYGNSQKNFKIEKGKSFFLEINFKNYNKVTAQTTIPNQKDSLFCSIEYIVIPDLWDSSSIYYPVEISFKNISGFENILYEKNIYESDEGKYVDYHKIIPYLYNAIYDENEKKTTFITLVNSNTNNNFNYQNYYLYTISPELSKFLNFYDIVNENVALNTGFLSIFRGVFPEFSNINGGLGVFGSYLVDTDSVKIIQ